MPNKVKYTKLFSIIAITILIFNLLATPVLIVESKESQIEELNSDRETVNDPLEGEILDEKLSDLDLNEYVNEGWIQVEGEWLRVVSEETVDEDLLYLNENNIPFYKGLPLYDYEGTGYYKDKNVQRAATLGAKQKLFTTFDSEALSSIVLKKPKNIATNFTLQPSSTSRRLRNRPSQIVNEGTVYMWGPGGLNTQSGYWIGTSTFYIQGQRAFCIEYHKSGPPTGATGYSNISPMDDINILRTLYYGYLGPESIYSSSYEDSQKGPVVTTLVLTRLYDEFTGNNHPGARHRTDVPGYLELYNIAKGIGSGANYETPDTEMKFTTSNSNNSITTYVSSGVQRSNTITFDSFSKNTVRIDLSGGVKLVRTSSPKAGRPTGTYSSYVTIAGGDKFYFTAPLDYDGTFSTGNLSGSLPLYTPVFTATNGASQDLGTLETWNDPSNTANINVPFEAQTATVRVNHVDLSRSSSHQNRIFRTQTFTRTIGSSYTATRMTQSYLNNNYSDPYVRHPNHNNTRSVTVSSSGNTIDLYYTTEWRLRARYRSTVTDSSFRTTTLGNVIYGDQYTHTSPIWTTNSGTAVRDYDGQPYDYRNTYNLNNGDHVLANRRQSGSMPRGNLDLWFDYDPYGYVGVEWVNRFPQSGYNVFDSTPNTNLSGTRTGPSPLGSVNFTGYNPNSTMKDNFDMYAHGTIFEYSQPQRINVNGRVYERENNSKYSLSMGYQLRPSVNPFRPHQFYYRLIRNVTVNYLDSRTGNSISTKKEYQVKQGYNPSTHSEPQVTQTLLNNGYAWSERPPTLRSGDNVYRYTRRSGSKESGVVGTSNVVINYHYDLPLIETGLEKIQIFTAAANEGLPVIVDLVKENIYPLSHQNMGSATIDVNLYKGNQKIEGKTYTARNLPTQIEFTVSPSELNKGEQALYTVKLEGFNSNDISVPNNRLSLATDGYTSVETTLEVNANHQSELEYTGVIKTERAIGRQMVVFNESFFIPVEPIKKMKTGYGFFMPINLRYENELGNQGIDTSFNVTVPEAIVDKSFIDYDVSNNKSKVPLQLTGNTSNPTETLINQTFELQHVNVEKKTGHLFTDEQVNSNDARIKNDLISGDRKFYLPIWGHVGEYDLDVSSVSPIGVNLVNVKINHTLDIVGHMYLHMDSPTKDKDVIHFEPINQDNPFPNGIPNNWTNEEINTLKTWIEDDS